MKEPHIIPRGPLSRLQLADKYIWLRFYVVTHGENCDCIECVFSEMRARKIDEEAELKRRLRDAAL